MRVRNGLILQYTTAILGLYLIAGISPATALLENNAPKVQTVLAKSRALTITYNTVAELEATFNEPLISAAGGRISKIFVKSGSQVKQDQVLASLLPHTEIKAPFDGYLTDWQVNPGQYVTQGTTLVRLVSRDNLRTRYYVPEKFAPKLSLGQEVNIKLHSYNKELKAQVSYIAPMVEPLNHSILVIAEVLDEKLHNVLPGSFVSIEHAIEKNAYGVLVPEGCVLQKLDGYELYKVFDNKLIRQVVTVGSRSNGYVQITSGLGVGDEVVVTIPPGLVQGMDIQSEQLEL